MALVLALGVLVVLTILAAVMMTYTSSGSRHASLNGADLEAYALAEAGVNSAGAVLAAESHPEGWASHPTQAAPYVREYDVGTVAWWATCMSSYGFSCTLWKITAQSTVRNPTGPGAAAVHRTISIRMRVLAQGGNSAWAYLYSRGNVTLTGGVFVQEPLYVAGNLTMTGGVQIGLAASPVTVWGNVSMQTGNYIGVPTTTLTGSATSTATTLNVASAAGFPSYGMVKLDNEISKYAGVSGAAFTGATRGFSRTTAAPHAAGVVVDGRLAAVHIAGTCSAAGATGTTCDSTHRIFGASVDSSPTTIDAPVASDSIANWYAQSAPGPLNPCTNLTGTGAPLFDRAGSTTLNHDASTADLTPNSTYDCKVIRSGVTVGELAWNNTTKVLTVAGTVFFDGDIKTSQSLVFNSGTPGATIWTSGQITIGGGKDFCGLAKAGGGCDFDNWSPQTNALALISSKHPVGATYSTTNVLTMSGGSQVQGLFYVDGPFTASGGALVQGSVIANTITLTGGTGSPSPGIIDLPEGAPALRMLSYDSGSFSD
jgi:hypothetical protein